MRRLALLRHTAFPDFLPAIKATRPCWPCCFVGNTMNVRYGVCRRLPHENRSEISPRDLMVSNLKLSLHAETLAPLGATSSQHLAAALRRHTSTETVEMCIRDRSQPAGFCLVWNASLRNPSNLPSRFHSMQRVNRFATSLCLMLLATNCLR